MKNKVEVICVDCKNIRLVDYRMRWMIRVGKASGRCLPCGRKLMRVNLDGLKLGRGWNKGLKISGMSGKHQTKKQKLKRSEMNRLFPVASIPGVREKMRLAKLGKCGPLASRWEGGKTQGQKVRMLAPHKEWRILVLHRDNFTCQVCGIRGGKLEVDHIKSFSGYPELRLELSNGRTLCKPCHKNTPTYCRGKSFDGVSL